MNFTVTAKPLAAAGVASVITITLTGVGSLPSLTTFTASGAGMADVSPTLPATAQAGAYTSFKWTANVSGQLTVTASGGLTLAHSTRVNIARPNYVTAQQIIDQSLGMIGVRAPGESAKIEESEDALIRLNMLLDMWRTDSLFAFASSPISGTFPNGSRSVTIGPSGDILTPYRPVSINDDAFFTLGGVDYPMTQITQAQYNQIPRKGLGAFGPGTFYYSPDLPNGTLYLFPLAGGDVTLSLSASMELAEFADLTTTYVLPPGYKATLAASLAEMMAPDYERQPSPFVTQSAMKGRKAIRLANYRTPYLGTSSWGSRQLFGGVAADSYQGSNAGDMAT